jgi:hypothetical protein
VTTYFIAAIVILLFSLGFTVAAVIAGFKISKKVGVIMLLAPLLMAVSMAMVSYFSYVVGASQCGEDEAQAQGEAEAEAQIQNLEEVDNIDIGL